MVDWRGAIRQNSFLIFVGLMSLWFGFWFGVVGVSSWWGVLLVIFFNPLSFKVSYVIVKEWEVLMSYGELAWAAWRCRRKR